VVNCKTQAEVDNYWKKLSAGGKEVQCGWLKDKYGVSWQIVPTILGELLGGKDAAKSKRIMQAMLKMVKLDIKKLKQAAKQK
jgi:predicted 3-demethylubiquinone-9 3-methyltransferase (glyoxalase superfamily)